MRKEEYIEAVRGGLSEGAWPSVGIAGGMFINFHYDLMNEEMSDEAIFKHLNYTCWALTRIDATVTPQNYGALTEAVATVLPRLMYLVEAQDHLSVAIMARGLLAGILEKCDVSC